MAVPSTLNDFVESSLDYVCPPPGGAISNGSEFTTDDCDLWMASLAAHIKSRRMSPRQIVDLLHRRIEQIRCQRHFGTMSDTKMIERMNSWIREYDN